MNWRTTGILFIIVAALAGYLFWDTRQEDTAVPTPEAIEAPPPTPVRSTLISTTSENVQGLGITDLSNNSEIVFTQPAADIWLQIEPEETAVYSTTINTAVAGILNLTSTRTLPAEDDLSPFGLDEPKHRISVVVNQPESGQIIRVTMLIGDETPVGTSTYVLREGDERIHLLPSGILENLINLLEEPPIEPDE